MKSLLAMLVASLFAVSAFAADAPKPAAAIDKPAAMATATTPAAKSAAKKGKKKSPRKAPAAAK